MVDSMPFRSSEALMKYMNEVKFNVHLVSGRVRE